MAFRSLVVIDEFYDDPDAVRNKALRLQFSRKLGATYPGTEAVSAPEEWTSVRSRLRGEIDEPCDAPCPKDPPFQQGKFRLALKQDESLRIDKVHIDRQRWSGVIYLTPDRYCEEGLVLYRHRPTGSLLWDEKWFRENYSHLYLLDRDSFKREVQAFFRDDEQFEQIGIIPMLYNRAIVFMAQVFHGTGKCFGDSPENGRLTQHFEFYT